MKLFFITSLIAILLFAVDAAAQTPKVDESAWMTVVSEKSEFSLRMPRSSLVHVDDSDRLPRTTLFGFDGGVSIRFARTKNQRAKEVLRARSYSESEKVLAVEQKIADVELRMLITNDDPYRLTISAASDSKFYNLSITGQSKDDPAIAYVLGSIRIKGEPFVISKNRAAQDDGPPTELSSLKTSNEITDALKAKRPKWNGKINYKPLAEYVKTETEKSVREPIELTALRPKFNFSPFLKGGLIRLRVVFKADGTIGDMTIYSDAERSILAGYVAGARDMRFLPAVGIDGKPVDSIKEYTMTFTTSMGGMIL